MQTTQKINDTIFIVHAMGREGREGREGRDGKNSKHNAGRLSSNAGSSADSAIRITLQRAGPPPPPAVAPAVAVPQRPQGVQSRLDDASFAAFLDGFRRVEPQDLLEARGGRVRYVIDGRDARGAPTRKYRLGGWLAKVDPALRFIRLFNPFAKKAWSVQLRPPDERVTLYYMPPGTSDEIAAMRNLLTQLESGQISVTRVA